MAEEAGFEPATLALTARRSATELLSNKNMVPPRRLELRPVVLQTTALPVKLKRGNFSYYLLYITNCQLKILKTFHI